MTKALVAASLILLGVCGGLAYQLAKARENTAAARRAHGLVLEARQREIDTARGQVERAEDAARTAQRARADAEARLEEARRAVPARLLLEREREAQTLSETPNLDGAKASLEAAGVPAGDLPTFSSTLAASWAAAARWRRVAAETQVKLELKGLELDVAWEMLVEAKTEGDLRGAQLELQIKTLDRVVAERDLALSERVSRGSRTGAVIGLSVGALGAVLAVSAAGCRSSTCREALILGGLGTAAAGAGIVVLTWE